MSQDWTEKKERGSIGLLRFMVKVATFFGRRVTRLLLYPISLYFFIVVSDSRKASSAYLTRALGRKPHWYEIFKHFFVFASVLLDRVYFLLNRNEYFDIQIMRDDYEELSDDARAGGVIVLGAHMGSFEAIRLVSRKRRELKLVLLMYEENARKIGAMMAAINPQAHQEIVPLGNLSAMLTVRDRLAEGGIIGILADRTLGHERNFPIPFFGETAYFAVGPFRMAAMMRKPVFLMVGMYCGGNRYEINVEKIADFSDDEHGERRNSQQAIDAAINAYVGRLEHYARLSPYNWFNFYDFWQGSAR